MLSYFLCLQIYFICLLTNEWSPYNLTHLETSTFLRWLGHNQLYEKKPKMGYLDNFHQVKNSGAGISDFKEDHEVAGLSDQVRWLYSLLSVPVLKLKSNLAVCLKYKMRYKCEHL